MARHDRSLQLCVYGALLFLEKQDDLAHELDEEEAQETQAANDDAAAAINHEQTIQSQSPRGVTVLIGTKDILRQPTGVVNKNKALSDSQIAITRSTLTPSQNDVVTLSGDAKVADVVASGSAITKGNGE